MERLKRFLALLLVCCIGIGFFTAGHAIAGPPSGFVEYRHPIGVVFKHPSSWTVQETALGLQVVPADAGSNAFGPTEAYIISLIGSEPGITSLDDPQAAQALQVLVAQSLPFLRPAGAAKAIKPNSPARLFTWTGRNPQGLDVETRVYGQLVGGYFLSLTAIGDIGRINGRSKAMLQIFETLRLVEPKLNQKLAGTWYTTSYSSAGRIGDRVNVSTSQSVTLLANGRLQSSSQTAYSGTTARGQGSVTGLADASREAGRWAVSGNSLYILWKSGGAAKYSYYLQGAPGRRELLLQSAGGQKVLWTEYNF